MLAKKRGDNRKKERFTVHASLCGRDNPLKALGSVALFSENGILYRTNDNSVCSFEISFASNGVTERKYAERRMI